MNRTGVTAPAVLALSLALLAAAPAARAELHVLAPPDGAILATSPVTLIGTGATASVEITVTTPKTVGTSVGKLSGKAFTAAVKLDPGENMVLVKSGDQSQRVVYTFAPEDQSPRVYRFHPPVADGDCKACHPQGVGRTSPISEAKLCNACHDPKTGAKILHGPLGAGICSSCHDPHGSSNPRFLVLNVRALCIQCHAQSRSQAHIERSGTKSCPECHDPHGSNKQYLLY
jgi:predicted CXXCH cytochrome family protein